MSEGATVAILDVGAGPLTMVGKRWPGRKVVVTAVDPLASEYGAILEEAGIEPIVRTQFGEVERLRDLFPANAFDFVHMRNALDHSYDPLQGIVEMLRVVKLGSFVYLQHRPNEGVTQEYSGLHQWNFSNEDGAFVIWNDEVRINVNQTVGGFAQTSVRDVEGPWIEVKMRKLAEPPRSLAQSGPWRKLTDIFKRR